MPVSTNFCVPDSATLDVLHGEIEMALGAMISESQIRSLEDLARSRAWPAKPGDRQGLRQILETLSSPAAAAHLRTAMVRLRAHGCSESSVVMGEALLNFAAEFDAARSAVSDHG